jgi:hypothetical protein
MKLTTHQEIASNREYQVRLQIAGSFIIVVFLLLLGRVC